MKKVGMIVGLVGIVVWGMSGLAHATIMNGDFSAGLMGWTTTDRATSGNMVSPSASVSEMGGQAVLATQGLAANIALISLSQAIDIPTLATTLSFDIGLVRGADTLPTGFGFPDFLQASYLDATDANFDRAFVGLDVPNGAFDPSTFAPVSLLALGNGLLQFTTPITALAGHSGTLFFDLSDQDDGFFSTARVDNVSISVSTTAVPEPGTWLLVGSGLMGLAGLVWQRCRQARH